MSYGGPEDEGTMQESEQEGLEINNEPRIYMLRVEADR